jgi:plastocyanin
MLKLTAILVFAAVVHAESITGSVVVRRKLTKRSVTPAVSFYERGPVVGLSEDGEAVRDPLGWERSHVAVWIEGERPGNAISASMKQVGRRFVPDMLVIPAGSSVAFPNMDPIFHNVFSLSKLKSFDLGYYPRNESRSVAFPKPGIVSVNCHLHPNMAGVVVVAPNQWATLADAAGVFRIANVPPGRYTVAAWHKTAGLFSKTVDVAPGSGASIEFLIPVGDGPE